LAKLFTAKNAIEIGSEGMECFGGVGYMENSGIPVILRDLYVLSIWEGTTNVLSLDFIRVIQHSSGIMTRFFDLVKKRFKKSEEAISSYHITFLNDIITKLSIPQYFSQVQNSRALSFIVISLYVLSLLLKYQKKMKGEGKGYNKNLINYWILKTDGYVKQLSFVNDLDVGELKKYCFDSNNFSSKYKAKF